jgi:cysteine desulfurase
MGKKIYLDHAATTPVDREVLKTMLPYFSEKFGNPMSLHQFGQESSEAMEKAREIIANFFHAEKKEIIFTSGATEANNLAIKGIVRSFTAKNKIKPHIITTAFEHHCVLNACKRLEKDDLAEVTFLRPDKEGMINLNALEKAIKPNTILVSVMYVNNEIGTVQPIAEIGKLIKKINQKRGIKKLNKIIFHTDATQAINYFDCNVNKLGVDLLSMSAHKIYGPKGTGLLYVRQGVYIKKEMDGGAQESGMRAGTHNMTGIVGLGAAIKKVKEQKLNIKNIKKLRDYLIKRVLKEIPDVQLNGSKIKRSPNNANFGFKSVEGESLILLLDQEGIAASTGSACSSGSLEPSHVLLSLGLKAEETHGSLRLSLGKDTTRKEIEYTLAKLKKVIGQLRQTSGDVLEDYYKKNK